MLEFPRYLLDRHRILFTLLVVVLALGAFEYSFVRMLQAGWLSGLSSFVGEEADSSYAPEVWFALLTLILGTLIIVISIASQNTPNLIDFYTRDWWSLLYVWFIKLALIQCLVVQLSGFRMATWSPFLNTYVYLPICGFLVLPYIFYILRQTKTSTIIEKIHSQYVARLRHLSSPLFQESLQHPAVSSRYHKYFFDAFNQLDDLLNYSSLKEPKALAIARIGDAVWEYVCVKKNIHSAFREDSSVARSDVNFLTIQEQWKSIEESECVLEAKGLRVLTGAYARLVSQDEYDLASLTASQFVGIARAAARNRDLKLIEVIVVSFNTLMRFAIKHAVRQREIRNVYNLLFFFRQYVIETAVVDDGKSFHRTCEFLRTYAAEIYDHGNDIPSFKFLTDVCVSEMRAILVHLERNDWSPEEQEQVLEIMLEMDDLTQQPVTGWKRRLGVRTIQTGLALFYLTRRRARLAERIIEDILAPYREENLDGFTAEFSAVLMRIQAESATFWEDTDRGNLNIYHSPNLSAVPAFIEATLEVLLRRFPHADPSGLEALARDVGKQE